MRLWVLPYYVCMCISIPSFGQSYIDDYQASVSTLSQRQSYAFNVCKVHMYNNGEKPDTLLHTVIKSNDTYYLNTNDVQCLQNSKGYIMVYKPLKIMNYNPKGNIVQSPLQIGTSEAIDSLLQSLAHHFHCVLSTDSMRVYQLVVDNPFIASISIEYNIALQMITKQDIMYVSSQASHISKTTQYIIPLSDSQIAACPLSFDSFFTINYKQIKPTANYSSYTINILGQ